MIVCRKSGTPWRPYGTIRESYNTVFNHLWLITEFTMQIISKSANDESWSCHHLLSVLPVGGLLSNIVFSLCVGGLLMQQHCFRSLCGRPAQQHCLRLHVGGLLSNILVFVREACSERFSLCVGGLLSNIVFSLCVGGLLSNIVFGLCVGGLLSNIVFGLYVGGPLSNILVDWMPAVRISSWHRHLTKAIFACHPALLLSRNDWLGSQFV